MDLGRAQLKFDCLLRRAGLSQVPVSALVVVGGICLVALVLALFQFWPIAAQSEDFSLEAQQQAEASSSAAGQEAGGSAELVIDVEGQVVKPGLVRVCQGARLGDVIEAAGGFTKRADRTSVNLAQLASDGMQLTVAKRQDASDQTAAQASSTSSSSSTAAQGSSAQGKVNINTASVEELQQLQGIGPSIAQRIVDYRSANGFFVAIENLKDVSGIGDARFAAVKDAICV